MITQDELKRIFHYEPTTGIFTRLVFINNRLKVGDIATCINGHGYRVIKINSKTYKAHRLAYLYMTGEFPLDQIDHIDGVRINNCWFNLRNATQSINSQNLHAPHKDNNSGYIGVSWCKKNKKWRARIKINNKGLSLGYFADAKEASESYLKKKREIHAGCTI